MAGKQFGVYLLYVHTHFRCSTFVINCTHNSPDNSYIVQVLYIINESVLPTIGLTNIRYIAQSIK